METTWTYWKGWQLSDFRENDSAWIRHDPNRDINYVYINIPKNASSWMKNNFGGYAYNFRTRQLLHYIPDGPTVRALTENKNPPTYVIVLRDPIERWLSGAAQSFHTCSPKRPIFFMNMSDELLFDVVAYDEHTAPQTMFLKGVDLSRVVWFDCTDALEQNIVSWSQDKFKIFLKPAANYKENVYKISKLNIPQKLDDDPDNWTMMQCIEALRQRLYSNPKHIDRLKDFYKDDYELRASVEFYKAA